MRPWAAGIAALAVLLAAPASARGPVPVPVILDADLGDDIDDAYALAWALTSPRLKVEAIVTAFGDTALRARMARRMLAAMHRTDVPVGQGVATPPATVFTQAAWAQGGPEGAAPDGIALALDRIRRHPGGITLVALAPMTNVKAMIARDPATFARLKRVVMMGGSIRRGYGDKPTPDAEYNAAQDPAGLRALLASGVPVTMLPLDSTQVRSDAATLARVLAASPTLAALTAEWRALNPWKQTVPTLFDAVTVGAVIDPRLCPTEPMRIAVDDKGFTREEAGSPNAAVCLASDGPRLIAHMAADITAAGR